MNIVESQRQPSGIHAPGHAFTNSETLADQERSVALFSALAAEHSGCDGFLDYAHRHHEVIARFGRFPHRNAALGRPSTPEETSYLAQPGSGF